MSIVPQNLNTTSANELVVEQMDRLNTLADDMIELTEAALTEVTDFAINGVDLDPRFQWEEGDLQGVLDQLGTIPSAQLDDDWLDNVNLSGGNDDFVFSPALLAKLSETLPDYIMPAMPTLPVMPEEPADPGEPTTLVAPDEPVMPVYEAPDTDVGETAPVFADFTSSVPVPIPRAIVLPDPPTLLLSSIAFEGVRPVFDVTEPDLAQFQFTPGTYEPLMLTELKTAILSVLQGGTGLPAALENAIFEQAREREVELGERDIDQTSNEFGAKGYKYPPGAVAKRVDRVRRDASLKISGLNREQFVARFRLEVEQFRAVLASAIGLEEMWVSAFAQAEQLRFDASQMQLNFALQIFNAQLAKINAQAQLYQVDAQIYKDRIEAEAQKLSAYAAELQAKQLIGELNKQDMELYAQRLNALVVNAELYKARTAGWADKFRAVDSKIATFKALLDSNTTLASVYESSTRAFSTKVEAQKARDERFGIKAEIFSTKTAALKNQFDTLLAAYNNNFKIAELKRDTFVANSERVREYIAAESGRIDALVKKYQAFAAEIGAKSEVEKSRYAVMLSYAQAQITRMQAAADVLMKNGEINIQAGLQAANLLLRGRETAATTLAQLAAGLTSAASVNAGVSQNYGGSLSYSYNGELDVA